MKRTWLNGRVNKQNCRIWSEANPQGFMSELAVTSRKLTVWSCGPTKTSSASCPTLPVPQSRFRLRDASGRPPAFHVSWTWELASKILGDFYNRQSSFSVGLCKVIGLCG
ncbi:hypothetical protein TNCV_1918761 [Trichonephila clavipes]|nr:hypothetical protein TNCV_1918761 [Trichonephila clavipes]